MFGVRCWAWGVCEAFNFAHIPRPDVDFDRSFVRYLGASRALDDARHFDAASQE